MPKLDPRVDQYIENSPEYAQPILSKIRKAFHKGCPEVEEAIKWGCPHFLHHGMLGGMASFKKHVSFGFWRSKELEDPEELFETGTGKKASMCNAHVHNLKELPTQKVLVDYVRRATILNQTSPSPKKASTKKISTEIPTDLADALKKNTKAKKTFESFAPSHKRDYIEWINEAKRKATREKRLATTIEWLSEGRRRNWKYETR
ncbi:MAG: YdeI/OmpD-associated family protein [Planctomycetota bacterium]